MGNEPTTVVNGKLKNQGLQERHNVRERNQTKRKRGKIVHAVNARRAKAR